MRILKISIQHEKKCKAIEFSSDSTLIFSVFNSCGKTTLLRFILHSLGFTIPSLSGLKMEECSVVATIQKDDGLLIHLFRKGKDYKIVEGNQETFYRLPRQLNEVLSSIFGIDMSKLSQFVLGSMYIDQDRGWTLLNRGSVIGRNKFQIDAFMSMFCGNDAISTLEKRDALESERNRYRELVHLFDRQKTLDNVSRNDVDTTVVESLQGEIDILNIRLNQYNADLSRVKSSIKSNKDFKDYIDNMRLYIQISGEEPIRLKSEMIVPAYDLDSLLEARSLSLQMKIKEVKAQLITKTAQLNEYTKKLGMDKIVESYSITPLSKVNLDVSKVQSSIKLMDKAISECNTIISKSIDLSPSTKRLNEIIVRNAAYLGVNHYLNIDKNVSRISELKTYSGTDYKKMVFAYRLAYCSLIREEFGIILPLIIDSPRNEVDNQNISKMMGLIDKYYCDHQIIIASIYNIQYNFNTTIELKSKNMLLDEDITQCRITDFF